MRKLCLPFLAALVVGISCSPARADDATPAGTLIEKRIKDLGPIPLSLTREILPSYDGERFAYVVVKGTEKTVFCDGKPGKTYLHTSHHGTAPAFSPDGSHLAYRACPGETWHIVLDGKELPKHTNSRYKDNDLFVQPSVGRPAFSPDSKHMAYSARIEGRWRLVRDGKVAGSANPSSTGVGLFFSPNSRKLAHRVGGTIVCDGRAGRQYSGLGPPIFSPNSAHLAYMARGDKEGFIIYNGKEGPHHRLCYSPVFAPNSRGLAYGACVEGTGWFIMHNGKQGRSYDDVGTPVFSPDSRKLAYYAKKDRKFFIICNRVEGPIYNGARKPVFSPDSKHMTYVGVRDLKEFIVCDDREGSKYPHIRWHSFSSDGKHLACVVEPGKSRYQAAMVCDGLIGPRHRHLWVPKNFLNYPKKLRYVVADRNHAWLVEVDWPTDRDWTHGLKPAKP